MYPLVGILPANKQQPPPNLTWIDHPQLVKFNSSNPVEKNVYPQKIMADNSKLQTHLEIKQQCAPMASTFSTEMTADERVPFPFFRPLSQKRANTWIISLFVILHLGAFTVTMIVNDCWENSHGDCALKPLRRFSFQPLSENPLLGPSASTSVPSFSFTNHSISCLNYLIILKFRFDYFNASFEL